MLAPLLFPNVSLEKHMWDVATLCLFSQVYFEEVKYVKTQRGYIPPFTIDNYVITLKSQNDYQSQSVIFEQKKLYGIAEELMVKQTSEEVLMCLFRYYNSQ